MGHQRARGCFRPVSASSLRVRLVVIRVRPLSVQAKRSKSLTENHVLDSDDSDGPDLSYAELRKEDEKKARQVTKTTGESSQGVVGLLTMLLPIPCKLARLSSFPSLSLSLSLYLRT